jgi:hypothetical protein
MDSAFDNLPIIPHEHVADVDCGCTFQNATRPLAFLSNNAHTGDAPMDSESTRRIQVASCVLWRFSSVDDDPLTASDTDAIRALAETEREKLMALDELACIVIRRTPGLEKSRAQSA